MSSAEPLRRGSPPRGRGTPGAARHEGLRRGLTPAWAGNTRATAAWSPTTWAHPRVGGEHFVLGDGDNQVTGSPPRGRGTQPSSLLRSGPQRLTPAWAGNTASHRSRRPGRRAHPRVGGEHPVRTVDDLIREGSPPRGRGTHPDRDGPQVRRGLTPAWAGNTLPSWQRRCGRRAHPRVGGEHRPVRTISTCPAGSPPRGRGTHEMPVHVRLPSGLTPAWAGNTRPSPQPRRRPAGSPPRGRGTQGMGTEGAASHGLTPAWAGNTGSKMAWTRAVWAHPRVGGEHILIGAGRKSGEGSPPRGRGTPTGELTRVIPRGLTPAWAGNTARHRRRARRRQAHPRVGGEHRPAS